MHHIFVQSLESYRANLIQINLSKLIPILEKFGFEIFLSVRTRIRTFFHSFFGTLCI